jgi:hypothetical protein
VTEDGLTDADHQALSRLVVESLWRVDHDQGGTVHELFTDDGEIWYEGELFCSGRDAIKAWGLQRLESIRHLAANIRFEADGADRAVGGAVEIVFFDNTPERELGTTLPLTVGEWSFRCVKTADGWRFASIDARRLFDRRDAPPDLF